MSDDPIPTGEDVTGLKNTVSSLRNELRQLKDRYQGIEDPAAALAAMQELNTIKPQYETLQQQQQALQQQVNNGKIDSAIASTLAGVDPNYSELLSSNLRPLLQVGEDGNVAASNGRSLADLRTDYQAKYPTMFLNGSAPVPAGTGNMQNNGAAPQPATVVKKQNGMVMGVDPKAFLEGKVTLE